MTKHDRIVSRVRDLPRLTINGSQIACVDEQGGLRITSLGGISPDHFKAFAAWVADLAREEAE